MFKIGDVVEWSGRLGDIKDIHDNPSKLGILCPIEGGRGNDYLQVDPKEVRKLTESETDHYWDWIAERVMSEASLNNPPRIGVANISLPIKSLKK